MKLKSSYLLILLGTLGLFSLVSQRVTAAEVQTNKAPLISQSSDAQPAPIQVPSTQPVNELPKTRQAEKAAPVLSTQDSESLAQKAPVLSTQDSEGGTSTKTPVVARRTEQPSVTRVSYAPETPATVPEAPITIAQAPILPPAETVPATKTVKLSLGQLTFTCGTDSNTPATIAKLNKRELGIILWVSDLFTSKGFDPKTRCQQVSTRLEEYNKKHTLAYLTVGELNKQPVVCVTSKEDGSCGDGIATYEGLLFTLKPDSDSQDTLKKLADVLQDDKGKEKPLQE